MLEGDLLVLTARHEQHGDRDRRRGALGRDGGDVVAEEQQGPAAEETHERVFQIPQPSVQLVAERAQVRERRVRGHGADARVFGGGQERDGAAQREPEDADLVDPPRREEVDRAAKIAALAEADRRRQSAALAEVPLVEQQHGEARRQRGGDRQEIGLLGRIAVEQHDRRRAHARQEPPRELHGEWRCVAAERPARS